MNTNPAKEVSNLKLDLEDGWHSVMFCIGNEDMKKELTAMISAALGESVLEKVEWAYLPKFR